jgi:hypothetical protein
VVMKTAGATVRTVSSFGRQSSLFFEVKSVSDVHVDDDDHDLLIIACCRRGEIGEMGGVPVEYGIFA